MSIFLQSCKDLKVTPEGHSKKVQENHYSPFPSSPKPSLQVTFLWEALEA